MTVKSETKPVAKSAKKAGRDITEFRANHDKNYIVPKKIEAAIQKLGADSWDYEISFLKLAELSTTDLALFRDKFSDFIVEISNRSTTKRVWCGSKALATKLRAMT